ncbi:MAG: polysaccharide pyruvyl transferase family protein [Sphingobacteriales bacterium]|nr:MAG: polysaccharide pyruvyl transferase family protein [Sphingobacteriales bacterium]
MLIEVRGVGTVNKGAYLMLLAVKQALQPYGNKVTIVAKDTSAFSTQDIEKEGLKRRIETKRKGIEFKPLIKLLPKSLRHKLNLYLLDDVDVILDASGFVYGDQWSKEAINKRLGSDLKEIKGNNTTVVLLPQAFGPFEKNEIKDSFSKILDYSSLVFSRDRQSLAYLEKTYGKKNKVVLAPDFTNLLKVDAGLVPAGTYERSVIIIPNNKLIEKAIFTEEQYLSLLEQICKKVYDSKLEPVILIHEGDKDHKIAKKLNARFEEKLKVLTEPSALAQKALLGQAYAVISGRFHGLVSSLSQGVPSIATSWSHKYEELFSDYNMGRFIIGKSDSAESIASLVDEVLNADSNKQLRQEIQACAKIEKEKSQKMWDTVFSEVINKRK